MERFHTPRAQCHFAHLLHDLPTLCHTCNKRVTDPNFPDVTRKPVDDTDLPLPANRSAIRADLLARAVRLKFRNALARTFLGVLQGSARDGPYTDATPRNLNATVRNRDATLFAVTLARLGARHAPVSVPRCLILRTKSTSDGMRGGLEVRWD